MALTVARPGARAHPRADLARDGLGRQFGLYPVDGHRTRLVSRGTEKVARSVALWLGMRVMEPAAFIMTRQMLLNLKRRAEALAAGRAGSIGV